MVQKDDREKKLYREISAIISLSFRRNPLLICKMKEKYLIICFCVIMNES